MYLRGILEMISMKDVTGKIQCLDLIYGLPVQSLIIEYWWFEWYNFNITDDKGD